MSLSVGGRASSKALRAAHGIACRLLKGFGSELLVELLNGFVGILILGGIILETP